MSINWERRLYKDEEISRDLLDGLTVLQSESSLEDVYVLRKGE